MSDLCCDRPGIMNAARRGALRLRPGAFMGFLRHSQPSQRLTWLQMSWRTLISKGVVVNWISTCKCATYLDEVGYEGSCRARAVGAWHVGHTCRAAARLLFEPSVQRLRAHALQHKVIQHLRVQGEVGLHFLICQTWRTQRGKGGIHSQLHWVRNVKMNLGGADIERGNRMALMSKVHSVPSLHLRQMQTKGHLFLSALGFQLHLTSRPAHLCLL